MVPVRSIAECGVVMFGVRFGHGRSCRELGGVEDNFLTGSSYYVGAETLFWNLGRDSPLLGPCSHKRSRLGGLRLYLYKGKVKGEIGEFG